MALRGLLFFLAGLVQICGSQRASPRGNKFVMAFMQDHQKYQGSPSDNKYQLLISGHYSSTAVKVSVSRHMFWRTFVVNKGTVATVRLPDTFEMRGSNYFDMTVFIEANREISVFAQGNGRSLVGTSLVLPVHQLDRVYHVVTPNITTNGFKEFAIVAQETATDVDIYLKGDVLFNRQAYPAGSKLSVNLEAFQALQLQSSDDLSGTRIESKEPVAVFSGHSCIMKDNACNQVFEQLLPSSSWGTFFIVPVLPFQNRDGTLYVTASQNTYLKYQHGDELSTQTLESGEVMQLNKYSSEPFSISASARIQVLYFSTDGKSQGSGPLLVSIPAVTSFCKSYDLAYMKQLDNYAIIVAKTSDPSGIRIQRRPFEKSQWRSVPDTEYSWSEYNLGRGAGILSSDHHVALGVFILGFSQHDGYGSQAHCIFSMTCPANSHYEVCTNTCSNHCVNITKSCPETCTEGCQCDDEFLFDGVDCIPKEKCGCFSNGHYYQPNEMVLLNACKKQCTCIPGEGLTCIDHSCAVQETCESQERVMSCVQKGSCHVSSRGKSFVTAFMQNRTPGQPGQKLELYISGYHLATNITVSTSNTILHKTISEGEIISIELPLSLQMEGSDKFNKTVLIEADQDISVISYNYLPKTSDGTITYPIHQLGQLYYVVTPTENSNKEFAIIAHEDLTTVTIHLKGTVIYKSKVYPAGSIFVTGLKAFEAIQLQSTGDLSGTRIESTKPVAVLSGHTCVTKFTACDHVVEQLLPVQSWGTTFIVPALPFQTQYDIAYVVSAENTLMRYQSSSKKESRTLVAGEVVQLEVLNSQPLFISADAGIQVLFFFTGAKRGNDYYDPFLMNIPATTCYCNSYHIYGMKNFTNHAMIIAKSSESGRIKWEEHRIRWTKILSTEYSWAEEDVEIRDHAQSVEHENSPFGLFIYGGGQSNGYGTPVLCSSVPSCPVNSHYRVCANLCPTSCAKINDPDPCPETCEKGCQCDAGFFFDGLSCVSVESCGCSQDGHDYEPHETVLLNTCQEKCTCIPGQGLICEAHTCAADETCSLQEQVLTCVKRSCHVSSRGKSFVTAFMQNYNPGQPGQKLELYISGYHLATNITVSTSNTILHKTISDGEIISIELPLSLQMEGSDKFNKTVLIEADQDISVISYNYLPKTSDGTITYPIHQLGQLYYVVTPTDKSNKEFAIIAHEDLTTVTIHLKGTVIYKSKVYPAGSIFVTGLKAFEAIQLQSTGDLSGTRIESTKPVAVLSGHTCVTKFTACDHVVEQLLPVQSWGTTFIVPALPFQTQYDIAYVVSAENTLMRYQSSSKKESRTLVAGEVVQLEVLASQPLFISADAGIQVLFFFTGAKRGNDYYDPFLMNIPATTCYCNSYHIYGMKNFTNHAMIIAKSSESGRIKWEEHRIRWTKILSTEYSWAEEDVEIRDHTQSVEHENSPFGLFIYGGGQSDGYGTPVLCSSVPSCPVNSHYRVCANLCPTSCAKINDPDPCPETCEKGCQCDAGFFFDGLSCVSVESCGCSQDGHDYEPHETVLLNTCQEKCTCVPGQGLICEAHTCASDKTCSLQKGVMTCVKSTCNVSSRGKKFLTAFIYNYANYQSKKLELHFSGYHPATNIIVSTNSGEIHRTVNEGEITSIELPLSLEMVGSDIFNNAVLIEADKDISVSSYSDVSGSTAGTLIYPIDQLGQLYYVVTPTEDSSLNLKEFAVVAHENLTSVTIYLKGTVTFKNQVYPAGSIFVTDLKAFEAIQLQSTEDLSGTRIESTKPVAVLSGHICAVKFTACDHVVEQLLPVQNWGTTFIVPPLPFQTQYDIAYVVSAENTLMEYQSSSKKESRTMVAGEVVKLEVLASQPLFISADAGIQVHLFFTGSRSRGYSYDSFLMTIPAITCYCNSYHIYGKKGFINTAMIIAKSSESSGITMEGKAIRWTQIPGTEYSWAEQDVQVTDLAQSVEHKKTPFGLFVFGGSSYRGYGTAALCSSVSISCPENSHYEACGIACPATCSDRSAPSTCKNTCAQICQCDEGYVRSGEKCVPVETCNCIYKDVTYKAGEEFWEDEDCQSHCTCDAKLGKAVCRKSSCQGKTKCRVVNGVRGCHAASYSTCIGTGDPHYTTFDGKKYDFMGTCIYQLAGLCSKDPFLTPFLVTVENNHRGNKAVSYTKVVTVEIYNFTISMSQEFPQKIQVNGIFVELPFSYENKLSVYQHGVHGFVETDFDLRVSFDWYSYARVIIPNSYANALCGLCGNANQDPNDDFLMKDGTQTEDEIQFANSWKVKDIPDCSSGCTNNCPVCSDADKQTYQGPSYCGILTRKSGPFKQCHDAIDPQSYFDDCVYDTCVYQGHHEALCSAISSYVTACQTQGIQIGQWRSSSFCSISCPPNSHYELCGSGCPATCKSLISAQKCDVPCTEACFCDSGFIRSGDQCVSKAKCGCFDQGKYYKLGEEFYPTSSCQKKCICMDNATIACQRFSCGAQEECKVVKGVQGCHPLAYGKAIVMGDPHFISFDGRHFELYGSCTYTVAQVCQHNPRLQNFTVWVENEKLGDGPLVLIRSVKVFVHGYTVTLQRGIKWQAMVDGQLYTLPMNAADRKLWITQEGNNIIVYTPFGLTVLYDTSSYIHVSVPSTYRRHMCGLAGNFNGDLKDDFMLANGKLTENVEEFVASWKVPVKGVICSDGCGDKCPICNKAQKAKYEAGNFCGMIPSKTGPFKDCHSLVNPAEYFEHCLNEACTTNEVQESLCQSLQAYVAACQASGGKIRAWRSSSFCPLTCPAHSHYEPCTRTCDSTCAALSIPSQCSGNCFEGCQCDEDYVFDGSQCVAMKQCGCTYHGAYLKIGEHIYSEGCTEKCTCQSAGQLQCNEGSCQPETCALREGVRDCVALEAQCKLTAQAYITSFDGASGRYSCSGVYEIASLCDQNSASWFRLLASIEKDYTKEMAVGKSVYFYFQGGFIRIINRERFWVNGQKITLPYENSPVSMRRIQDKIVIDHDSQVQVYLHPDGMVTMAAKETLRGKLCAACGNFNKDHLDDLKLASGEKTNNFDEVLKSWEAEDFL